MEKTDQLINRVYRESLSFLEVLDPIAVHRIDPHIPPVRIRWILKMVDDIVKARLEERK